MLGPSLAIKQYNCFDGYILELASSIHDRQTHTMGDGAWCLADEQCTARPETQHSKPSNESVTTAS